MLFFKLNESLREENTEAPEGSGVETEVEVETEETEGSEEEGAEGEGEMSDEEVKQAKSLFKLLKDPGTSDMVIRQLADKAGLLKGLETKADVKEAKKDLKSIVKEKLGKEYEFLADKLGETLEAVLEEERASHKADFGKIEAQNTERQIETVLEKLARETKNESRKYETKMVELMEKFTIGKNISVEDYLRGLYAQASAGSKNATIKGQMADRIKRNSNDAVGRLASTSPSGNEKTGEGTSGNKKMSLNDAVNFAMGNLTKKGK